MSIFEDKFLKVYLKSGLGAMPKSDIDALVMHLLDLHGTPDSGPMARMSNQAVSEAVRTPVTKIKKLRYDAALKFGGSVEDQARGRLLAALSRASLETADGKICLIIEDTLAKNWLQGQLKANQRIFDHSFNVEIIKVDADALFKVLEACFDQEALDLLRVEYKKARRKESSQDAKRAFTKAAKAFAEGAAKAAGTGVVAILRAQLGLV
jgi:hypothetical protein